jgi:4-hydroxyphenylpyruvate dioxygenase
VRKGIATVSLSGLLSDKIDAVAAAGFDGLELFDNDLVASPLSPADLARRCADLGLSIDLFQPVRDVESVPPDAFDRQVLHRFRTKLRVMTELGVTRLLVCSNVSPDAIDDPDLAAEQLAQLGDLAAEHGAAIAFEALAWGRHVHRVAQAWDVVRRADHPAVTLAVDTFHMLSRGDDGAALDDVPGDRIGFLQVADAPLLDMNVLDWSRHYRCFPGEGTLDVAGVVAASVTAGYSGPLSLEVFSDVVREADPGTTARDAMRSLVFLEDAVAARLAQHPDPAPSLTVSLAAQPAAPDRVDTAFLEITGSPTVTWLLRCLGFVAVGRHRSKPVTWWRSGEAHVVVNDDPAAHPALGLDVTPVAAVAERARALLWPAVARTRGAGEARLPGTTSPSGLHVFLSAGRGGDDDWQRDFACVDEHAPHPEVGALEALDHVVLAVPDMVLNEEVSFLRTVLALEPGPVEEFSEPQGRLRSRAFRPGAGDLRVVLNVEDVAGNPASGITQVAFACDDVRARVRSLRAAGVQLMAVPDNYYVDLDARLGLGQDLLADLREHQLLYDQLGRGELLHAFTEPLDTGFHVELLERRGGYDGFGSAGTHVRLATQRARRASR